MSMRSKLINPRSIQVTPQALAKAKYGIAQEPQGLGVAIASAWDNLNFSQASQNQRLNRANTTSFTYDYSSIYWAFGISVALFLFVTLLRNK